MHWSDKYLGWEYVVGSRDCAALAAEVWEVEFNRHVIIPRNNEDGVFSHAKAFTTALPDLAIPTEFPTDGDLVLMNIGNRACHIGVYCGTTPPTVLHALRKFGSAVRHPLPSLNPLGLTIQGYYKYANHMATQSVN